MIMCQCYQDEARCDHRATASREVLHPHLQQHQPLHPLSLRGSITFNFDKIIFLKTDHEESIILLFMAGVWFLPVPLLPLLQPRPRPGVAALTLLPRHPPGSQRLHSEDDTYILYILNM